MNLALNEKDIQKFWYVFIFTSIAYLCINWDYSEDDKIKESSNDANDSTRVASNQRINLCYIHIHATNVNYELL